MLQVAPMFRVVHHSHRCSEASNRDGFGATGTSCMRMYLILIQGRHFIMYWDTIVFTYLLELLIAYRNKFIKQVSIILV